MLKEEKEQYEDDAKEGVAQLLQERLPWLIVGLIGGGIASQIAARYETLLASHISLAFFIPIIVYMSDAVGTQTETVYVRNLSRKQLNFWIYLIKEFLVGIAFGVLFGFLIGSFAYLWRLEYKIALTVGLAMAASVASAPIIALITSVTLQKEHADPAVGAGPFTTIIQDLISLFIYFTIASVIIFK